MGKPNEQEKTEEVTPPRVAFCAQCGGNPKPSSKNLAFFEAIPDKPDDRYYCGCRGWD